MSLFLQENSSDVFLSSPCGLSLNRYQMLPFLHTGQAASNKVEIKTKTSAFMFFNCCCVFCVEITCCKWDYLNIFDKRYFFVLLD